MLKKIFIAIILSLFASPLLKAQLNKPQLHAIWKQSTKKINDCEYDLIFNVTLDKDWHTFSIVPVKGAEMEVFSTQVIFKPGKDYSLVGTLTESKPKPEWDETINKTVMVHYNKVVFTQRVKLQSPKTIKITGTYEYQVCKNVCDKPPHEDFVFDLQGTNACSNKK